MTSGFTGSRIASDCPTDRIWRVVVDAELFERGGVDPARVKIKGDEIRWSVGHDCIQHLFGGSVVRKHQVYPVSPEDPRLIWILVCPRFDPTLNLFDALGVAKMGLEHGGTSQRHMHMTIDETGQNETTVNFDALCLVAGHGRRGLGIAHEDDSVTFNNNGIRP